MFELHDSLEPGLRAAQSRLAGAASAVARANAGTAGRSTDAAMADTAQAAIFNEALLSAEHARLAELKAVTKTS